MNNAVDAVLLLDDGKVFHGKSIGAIGTYTGEIAFNTGMTGYQEIFTDPSYYNQLLVMATAHIGNYGTIGNEVESQGIKISGLICKKFSETHSRVGDTKSLQANFEENNIGGISEIDTRSLVRYIRDKGAMNAIISSDTTNIVELKDKLSAVPSMDGLELSSKVSAIKPYSVGDGKYKVALLDYGVKQSIINCLVDRDCTVHVFPYNSSSKDVLAINPDGILLSNGPGDPSVMLNEIEQVTELVNSNKPIFGICLGHQILSLSQGLTTVKMHNGHRGINHPIKNLLTGKGEITSQNHGFVVSKESAEANDNIEITHIHLNDQTLAGIQLKNSKVFSVQYHPEASPGPHDSRYLFDQFVSNMDN